MSPVINMAGVAGGWHVSSQSESASFFSFTDPEQVKSSPSLNQAEVEEEGNASV